MGFRPHPSPHDRSYGRSDETLDIAAVRPLTELTESEPKPLGAVRLECQGYPVVALALKEILKEEADVYEGSKPPPWAETPSCIVLCPTGKDIGAEVRRLGASNPQAAVLLFCMGEEPHLAHRARLAGARGFLHAGMHPEQIVHAVRLASEAQNKAVVPIGIPLGLLKNKNPMAQEPIVEKLAVLTPRQKEILELVCEGLANAQIGERLFLTESTVKQHLHAAYKLLKVRNRVQAAKLIRSASIYSGGQTN